MAKKKKSTRRNQALTDLIRISNVAGSDSALVAGDGGNTSVKTDDRAYMYIKASGTALKDMDAKQGWRRIAMARMPNVRDPELATMETYAREEEIARRLLAACDDKNPTASRPSVESILHALLGKVVIHLHPVAIGSFANARDGKGQIEKIFAREKYPPLWSSYANPGFTLAKAMHQRMAKYKKQYGRNPDILILEKHGLFVTAETAEAALRLMRKVVRMCQSKLTTPKAVKKTRINPEDIQAAKLAVRSAIWKTTGQYSPVYHYAHPAIEAFMARKDAAALLNTGPLSLDEMVYANGPAVCLKEANTDAIRKKINTRLAQGNQAPAAYVVQGLGLFVAAERKPAETIRDLAMGSMEIRSQAVRFGGIAAMNRREQEFIRRWYQQQRAQEAGHGSLQDRIAVVTGAGSGLGRSIAIGMARAGAMVAIADIDLNAAQETVELIATENPAIETMVLPCNVTSESAVETAFQGLLDQWGGLDVLVNAAGIAPAGALVDLPVAQWRLALEINLTGYYLMAQKAARIMIDQDMGGSIVNLSSKSGLDASKNNSPYNATKAGEIHMARGWAMELGEHGIRVNSVCPGNVFEGSKIWNPKYIRTCAKKYGIKPEEVIPYYVDKTILKREIKGQDIADAVVFLSSDQARTITGQTLVADGGQVMVR